MQEPVTHTYRKDFRSRGSHGGTSGPQKKEDYEKEMDGKRETIAVTKTIQQRCEGSAEHLVEDSEK